MYINFAFNLFSSLNVKKQRLETKDKVVFTIRSFPSSSLSSFRIKVSAKADTPHRRCVSEILRNFHRTLCVSTFGYTKKILLHVQKNKNMNHIDAGKLINLK